MRKLFATLLLTSLALPLHAQRNTGTSNQGVPPRYLNVPAEKEAKVEKTKDSRSLFQRLFGARPTPTPTPAPAPTPVAKRRAKPKSAPVETPEDASARVTPPTGAVAVTVKPKIGKGSGKKGAPVGIDAGAFDDATKFSNAKARAIEDAHIKDLKGKADGEVNEAESHKALVNYNRALFQKIREIDPSVSDYAGKVEQSMTRRLGAEKGKE